MIRRLCGFSPAASPGALLLKEEDVDACCCQGQRDHDASLHAAAGGGLVIAMATQMMIIETRWMHHTAMRMVRAHHITILW